jgi:hypothetical protein
MIEAVSRFQKYLITQSFQIASLYQSEISFEMASFLSLEIDQL